MSVTRWRHPDTILPEIMLEGRGPRMRLAIDRIQYEKTCREAVTTVNPSGKLITLDRRPFLVLTFLPIAARPRHIFTEDPRWNAGTFLTRLSEPEPRRLLSNFVLSEGIFTLNRKINTCVGNFQSDTVFLRSLR